MKILHITAMNPLSPNSGIPAVLHGLCNYQNKIENVEARVMSLCADVTQINSEYFDYVPIQSAKKYIFLNKPDIAIIHSFFHYEFTPVAKILDETGVLFYIEPHGSFGSHAMEKGAIKKKIANATLFRRQIKHAFGYIFTNRQEQEDSVYRTKNDLMIPNGINPMVVLEAGQKKLDSFEEPTFYYLGRYDINHKGLDYLFDALEILDKQNVELKVNFYGTGNDEQMKYVKERISRFTVVKARECGTIYGDEKKKALETSNILLLTSRYEGSPMTILDGLSYGNPCLVTPGTNVSEEISDNKLGWTTDLDANAIAETVKIAIMDYKKSGNGYYERCKKHVIERYSWEKIAIESVKLYGKKQNSIKD